MWRLIVRLIVRLMRPLNVGLMDPWPAVLTGDGPGTMFPALRGWAGLFGAIAEFEEMPSTDKIC